MKRLTFARQQRAARFLYAGAIGAPTKLLDRRGKPRPFEVQPWQDAADVPPTRLLDTLGETLAAFILVLGGGALIGVASLIGGA